MRSISTFHFSLFGMPVTKSVIHLRSAMRALRWNISISLRSWISSLSRSFTLVRRE